MKALFIGSVIENTGKSMIALGLAKGFKGKVGYYKPFREELLCIDHARVVDQDTRLMKKALNLKHEEELLSPLSYNIFTPVSMKDIVDGYNKVNDDVDLMIIEGAQNFSTGCIHGASGMSIAHKLDAEIILVTPPHVLALDKVCVYEHLMAQYKVKLKGIILNMVDDLRVVKFLESKGTKVLGAIPTIRDLRFYRVKEIADALNAEVIAGEGGMDRVVEKVMVGAMTAETALKGMRRVPRKAMITGGDRADIMTAALSTDTSCLVLTGGLYPPKPIVAKAHELNIPILLVGHSTMSAAEIVDHLIARVDPDDAYKIELIADMISRHVDLDTIYSD